MPQLDLGDVKLNYREAGDPAGAPVVFAPALGTDLSIWDQVVSHLPKGLRFIMYDLRGHGGSGLPLDGGTTSMGALVRDAERLIDHLGLRDCLFVGLGEGGMIGQALAVKRLDLIRALVLCNTAPKLGTASTWAKPIQAVREGGIEAIASATLSRWFARSARREAEIAPWRDMLLNTQASGYVAVASAISGTDLYTPTSGLRLPTLVLAGIDSGVTPPDLVRDLAELIPGAEFTLLRGAGHLPMCEAPVAMAEALSRFVARIGHDVVIAEAEIVPVSPPRPDLGLSFGRPSPVVPAPHVHHHAHAPQETASGKGECGCADNSCGGGTGAAQSSHGGCGCGCHS